MNKLYSLTVVLTVMVVTGCLMNEEEDSVTSSSECDEVLGCDDGSGSDGGGGGDDGDGPTCQTKNGVVVLDQAPANVDDTDRKVTFCHATSSASNPFVVITTSIKACKAHEQHSKLPKGGVHDVFPTGGCAD